jgi:hypothetical protein
MMRLSDKAVGGILRVGETHYPDNMEVTSKKGSSDYIQIQIEKKISSGPLDRISPSENVRNLTLPRFACNLRRRF